MVWTSTVMASLFVTSALASMEPALGGMVAPRGDILETSANADNDLLDKRQTDTAPDMAQWDTDTSAACIAALSSLSTASNPSGTAVCYNLFSLDTTNGTFKADLRLYQVSIPFGDFQGIPPSDISVGLQYHGASVSPVSEGADVKTRNVDKRQATDPTQLQAYMFIGQINQDQMAQPMTMGVLEALVMPTVTLTGRNLAGQQVSTNVSSNEAAFVNGIFSTEVVMSEFSIASLAVDTIVAQMQRGEVAFVLPGVNILIFPVGLVVCSIWFVIGVGFYAFGTYERYNYRDTYRSRKARSDGNKPAYSARI